MSEFTFITKYREPVEPTTLWMYVLILFSSLATFIMGGFDPILPAFIRTRPLLSFSLLVGIMVSLTIVVFGYVRYDRNRRRLLLLPLGIYALVVLLLFFDCGAVGLW